MDYSFFVYKVFEEDGEVSWVCKFPDLKGCIGVGDTYDDAVKEGMLNKAIWLETAKQIGRELPIPTSLQENDYSGRFNLRIPKSLHRDLVLRAEKEGVSLNTFCLHLLSEGLGEKCAQPVFNLSFSIPTPTSAAKENSWKHDSGSRILKLLPTA